MKNIFKSLYQKIVPNIIKKQYLKIKKMFFKGSANYWESRYSKGGNSGAGSYNNLAKFKAHVLNDFMNQNKIKTVIEFGCGDGNQLTLANYTKYIGFDISQTAISLCRQKFKNDNSKTFLLINDYNGEKADCVLSLDVIYHLVEDQVFEDHIKFLFDAATKYVIIYSCDDEKLQHPSDNHVKTRNFTKYIGANFSTWKLNQHIPNQYPYIEGKNEETSWSDFYIFKKS